MQTKKTRTEITVETETVFRIRRAGGQQRSSCPGCGTERVMLTPGGAAVLLSISTREIYRLVESGTLHFRETSERQLLVCSESLLQHMREREVSR